MKLLLLITLLLASLVAAEPSKDDLKEALKVEPNNRGALYNLGMASYLDEEYPQAIEAWESLEKLEPNDWQLKAKLIQAYWAAGKRKEAEAAIKALREARSASKSKDLEEQSFFIRDQFVVGDVRVFTLEYFELEGDRPLLWKFILRSEKKIDRHFSLGSYNTTTEHMRSSGKLGPKERTFHLDGYWGNGDHQTFSFFKGQPGYSNVRNQVAEILRGERVEISSTTLGTKGEQDGTGQPATRTESKTEGGDKPQPESEGRSR